MNASIDLHAGRTATRRRMMPESEINGYESWSIMPIATKKLAR